MKFTVLSCATGILLAVGATAVSAQSEMDTDGDGMFSFTEMLAAYPSLTEDNFTTIDTNADGMVDPEELAAAQETGVIPAEG